MFRFDDIITLGRIRAAFPDDYAKMEAFFMNRGFAMPNGDVFLCPKLPREVIILGDSDHPIVEETYQMLRQRARTWFTTNKQTHNVHGIPSGVGNDVPLDLLWKHMNAPSGDRKLVYMNFSIDVYPKHRQAVWDRFKDEPWVTVESAVSRDEYYNRLHTHRFTICPRGNGVDTYKLWESIYLGAIPIVERDIAHDDWLDLPVVWIDDWSQVTPEFLATVDMSGRSLEKAKLSYWVNVIAKKKSRIPWVF